MIIKNYHFRLSKKSLTLEKRGLCPLDPRQGR